MASIDLVGLSKVYAGGVAAVDDLEAAIAFYSKLFATEPAKIRPGYANFAIAEPPLKLVLIEGEGAGGSLNHLGVEVESTGEVVAAQRRLSGCGIETTTEDEVTCCYAVQDKVWVDAPDVPLGGWEFYSVLADDPAQESGSAATACCASKPEGSVCCGGTPEDTQ